MTRKYAGAKPVIGGNGLAAVGLYGNASLAENFTHRDPLIQDCGQAGGVFAPLAPVTSFQAGTSGPCLSVRLDKVKRCHRSAFKTNYAGLRRFDDP
jgi:hypothetical protein